MTKTPLMADPIIVQLIEGVAGLRESVKMLVEDAREERQTTKEYREEIREDMEAHRSQIHAFRSEQQQLVMGLTGLQTEVTKLAKTLSDHESERKERAAVVRFVNKSAKVAWALFGTSVLALIAAIVRWTPWGQNSHGGGSP